MRSARTDTLNGSGVARPAGRLLCCGLALTCWGAALQAQDIVIYGAELVDPGTGDALDPMALQVGQVVHVTYEWQYFSLYGYENWKNAVYVDSAKSFDYNESNTTFITSPLMVTRSFRDVSIPAGARKVSVVVDAESDVAESSENNNQYDIQISVAGANPCPLAHLVERYGSMVGTDPNEVLDALRGVRSRLKAGTEARRDLVSQYYVHAGEVTRLLVRRPDLALRSTRLLRRALPAIGLYAEDGRIEASRADLREAQTLMRGVMRLASPELKTYIDELNGLLTELILERP